MKDRKLSHYQLVPVYEPEVEEGGLVLMNASVGICGLCGGIATSMGGSDDQVCVPCAEMVLRGRAREAIQCFQGATPIMPRLTEAMMRAACHAHYGDSNIDGVAMSAHGVDWSFRDAFKRMWAGARKALRKEGNGQ